MDRISVKPQCFLGPRCLVSYAFACVPFWLDKSIQQRKVCFSCPWVRPRVCASFCSLGRSTPWPCSCARAGTMTACPTITPTRRWAWTADLWTSCGCLTLSSSMPNLLGSTTSQWKTSWSACSPTESFYTAAGMSKPDYRLHQTDTRNPHSLLLVALMLTFFFSEF